MRKGILVTLLSTLLVLAVVLGACTQTPTTTQTSTSTAPLKVLKIGTTQPMNSPGGLQGKKWFDLYAKMVNDAGGWKIGNDTYKLQIIVYDDQAVVTKAEDNIRTLVLQDGCKFIIGGQTNQAAVDIPITEPAHVMVIGSDLTNSSADPNVQYYYTTGNFFNSALVYKICKDMVAAGVKSYVSVKPDIEMGHFIDPIIDAAWQIASGGSVKKLGTVFVDPTTVDFGPVATKVMSYHPDCADLIYLGMIANSVPNIYRALADVGFKGIILPGTASTQDVANLVTTVGKDFIEGGEVFSQDPTGYQTDPRMLSIINAYIQQYGQLETNYTAALNGMFLLEDAINATQSVDVDTIKTYLDHIDHPIRQLLGWEMLFARPDLNNLRTICGGYDHPIQKISNGQLVNFSQVTMKEQYLFTIISNNMVDTYKAYWEQYGYPNFPADEEAANTLHFTDLGITGHD